MKLLSGWCGVVAGAMAIVAIAAASPGTAAPAGDAIAVTLDQAQLMRLPPKVATIVIGNPLIADVTIQAGGLAVVTGKGYGITNIIALDRGGTVLLDKPIVVRGDRDQVVVVYRGVERESYSCTPFCERRITLGDNAAYFDAVLGQIGNRNGQAQSLTGSAK